MSDDFKQKRHSLRGKRNFSKELHSNYLRNNDSEVLEEVKHIYNSFL